ncbi:hypothetical protein HWV62_490 [Athelia sp. TMB]|nr:hypothetical protein HWV62_490 [Athelia sp. TMB]
MSDKSLQNAELLKAKGNAFFKDGKMIDSADSGGAYAPMEELFKYKQRGGRSLGVGKRGSRQIVSTSCAQIVTWGTDEVISLFDGWGPDANFPLEMKDFSSDELSRVSFLFGGVGDARHVFGTIIGAHRALQTLPKQRRSNFRVHLTMLDLHPNPLARDLCILMLLDSLTNQNLAQTEILEIKATIFYTYIGVALPSYCFERLCSTMRDLKRRLSKQPFSFPDWIHVHTSSAVHIIDALNFWLSLMGKKDVASMLQAHTPAESLSTTELLNQPGFSSEYRQATLDHMNSIRRSATEAVNRLTEQEMRGLGLIDPDHNGETLRAAQKFLPNRRQKLIDRWVKSEMDENSFGHLEGEHTWYTSVKVFLPPAELWSRHPGFEKFRDLKAGDVDLTPKQKKSDKRQCTVGSSPFPDLSLDIFESPRQFELYNHNHKISERKPWSVPDAPAYSHVSSFFDGVVETLRKMRGRIKVEVIQAELIAELSKWRFGDDAGRPAAFPTRFTRAWLSNVPYTLLVPRDVPRYLGCSLLRNEAGGVQIVTPRPLPRPPSELASRKELQAWLTRVFVCTIIPGVAQEGFCAARLPNNLVAFIGLLVHLQQVGFPAHWLSDFLQDIISDNLVTEIAPYTGRWPIPITEISRRVAKRKVRLDPWLAELETILAMTLQGLPFAISLPPDFAQTPAEIGLFETDVREEGWHFGFVASEPTLNLIFYPSSQYVLKPLLASIHAAFEGHKTSAPITPGSYTILTAMEAFDRRGVVRWRMSHERVRRMIGEGWYMAAYRTDSKELVIKPVPASRWRDVGSAPAQPAPPPFLDVLPVD